MAAQRGEFFGWLKQGVGDAWQRGWQEIDLRDESVPLPDPVAASGYIVTGSPASVTERASWMLRAEAWLRNAVAKNVPVLGICFGHQLLGQALGGRVARNPRGREIGSTPMTLKPDAEADPLFEGLAHQIIVNMTHVDTVVELPPGATVLAETELESHAAFRCGSAWGVQFHPEIDAEMMRGYLRARRTVIEGEGLPCERLLQGTTDTPQAARVLRRFAARLSPGHGAPQPL